MAGLKGGLTGSSSSAAAKGTAVPGTVHCTAAVQSGTLCSATDLSLLNNLLYLT